MVKRGVVGSWNTRPAAESHFFLPCGKSNEPGWKSKTIKKGLYEEAKFKLFTCRWWWPHLELQCIPSQGTGWRKDSCKQVE